ISIRSSMSFPSRPCTNTGGLLGQIEMPLLNLSGGQIFNENVTQDRKDVRRRVRLQVLWRFTMMGIPRLIIPHRVRDRILPPRFSITVDCPAAHHLASPLLRLIEIQCDRTVCIENVICRSDQRLSSEISSDQFGDPGTPGIRFPIAEGATLT